MYGSARSGLPKLILSASPFSKALKAISGLSILPARITGTSTTSLSILPNFLYNPSSKYIGGWFQYHESYVPTSMFNESYPASTNNFAALNPSS